MAAQVNHKDFVAINWNARGLRQKKNTFEQFLYETNPHVCAVSETKLEPILTPRYKNYKIIHHSHIGGRGGVALFIRNDIKFKTINYNNNLNSPEVVPAIIKFAGTEITIVATYASPTVELNLDNLLLIKGNILGHFIIMGDFNCRHTSWGCHDSNTRGKEMLKFLEQENVVLLNDGAATRIPQPNQHANALDLTIVSPSLAPTASWEVYDDCIGSDHLPTITKIQFSWTPSATLPTVNMRNFRKANWDSYTKEISILLPTFKELESIDENYNSFIKIIQDSAEKTIPRKTPHDPTKQRQPAKSWWNEKCSNDTNMRKQASRNGRNFLTAEKFIEIKKTTAIATKTTNKAKRQGWKDYSSSLNRETPLSEIWSSVKAYRIGITKNSIPEEFNSLDIEEYIDSLCPASVPTEDETQTFQLQDENYDDLHTEFNNDELDIALSSTNNSAPGLDEINYKMIKSLPKKAKKVLLKIYNKIWKSGKIPKSWSEILISPKLKPGKIRGQIPSYRPIAQSSCIVKIFEKLVDRRLCWFLEHNDSLSPYITGCRKGKSCLDNLSTLITEAQIALGCNKSTVCAFFDISSAYDNVHIPTLINRAKQIGIPLSICKFLKNFLTLRTYKVRIGRRTSKARSTYRGLQQGSVLSPKLFIIYTASLITELPFIIKGSLFVDDLALYTRHASIKVAIKAMEDAIKILIYWLNSSQLDVNPNKSSAMLITRKRDSTVGLDSLKLKFKNVYIPFVKNKKFLGIILDHKLTWKPHIDNVTNSCHKALNILKATCGTWWGSDPNTACMLYKSLVRSKIEYGSFLFGSACNKLLEQIERIQNSALRLILGAFRSSPIQALQSEAHVPPINIRIKQISDNFCLKLLKYKKLPLINNLFQLKRQIDNDASYWTHKKEPILIKSLNSIVKNGKPLSHDTLPCFSINYPALTNKITPHYINVTKEDRYIDNLANEICKEYISEKFNNYYHIYTDGSKNQDNVGAAFITRHDRTIKNFKLPSNCSIYTAEAYAISQALSHVIDNDIPSAVIFSDSKSVLQTLETNAINTNISWLIFVIRNKIYHIKESNYQIELVWIPAHCGILGNEIVDEMAKLASSAGELVQLKLPVMDLKSKIIQQAKQDWEEHYYNSIKPDPSWYQQVQNTLSTKSIYSGKFKSKRYYTILTRLRIGHNRSPSHLAKLNIIDNSNCNCGHEHGSPQHMFFECHIADQHRAQLIIILNNLNEKPPYLLEILLAKNSSEINNALISFVIKTNMPI